MVNMSLDDFGEDWIRPVEQEEDFSEEMGNILHSVSPQEREKVTCYYKLQKRLPDIEYEAACESCEGFPIRTHCPYYTTQEHVEGFTKRMRPTDLT